MSFLLAVVLVAALHSPRADVREHALQPLLLREARAHGLYASRLRVMAYQESTFRVGKIGDHGKAAGLLQVHGDAIPGSHYTRAELLRPDVNVHVACLRLLLAKRRCGGGWRRFEANYNGRACGVRVYVAR